MYILFIGIDETFRSAQDLVRNLFWGVMSAIMYIIKAILNSLINGVVGFDILTNNSIITTAYNCCLALMFVILPAKIAYEIVTSMLKDDDAGLDLQKKMGSALLGVMIACSLTLAIKDVISPTMKGLTSAILQANIERTSNTENVSDEMINDSYSEMGNEFIKVMLVSFGQMPEGGNYGADSLITQVDALGDDFDICERWENDADDGTYKKFDYKWKFSFFWAIIALTVYCGMLLYISAHIGKRTIEIGFYYIIAPLCCTSLSNYNNPQAFIVWKNTIFGAYAQNLSQIFLLALSLPILQTIVESTLVMPLACAVLMFGAYSLIMTVPNFVQAMIGGYASGIMDILNSTRGGLGAISGLAKGGMSAILGTKSSTTGQRQGGLRGSIMGNKQADGSRKGGIKGAVQGNTQEVNGVQGKQGGLRGAVMGNDSLQSNADGTTTKTRQGGVAGAFSGRKSTTFDKNGNKTSQSRDSGFISNALNKGEKYSESSSFDGQGNVTGTTTRTTSGGLINSKKTTTTNYDGQGNKVGSSRSVTTGRGIFSDKKTTTTNFNGQGHQTSTSSSSSPSMVKQVGQAFDLGNRKRS